MSQLLEDTEKLYRASTGKKVNFKKLAKEFLKLKFLILYFASNYNNF
jgi:hypothetical protein